MLEKNINSLPGGLQNTAIFLGQCLETETSSQLLALPHHCRDQNTLATLGDGMDNTLVGRWDGHCLYRWTE